MLWSIILSKKDIFLKAFFSKTHIVINTRWVNLNTYIGFTFIDASSREKGCSSQLTLEIVKYLFFCSILWALGWFYLGHEANMFAFLLFVFLVCHSDLSHMEENDSSCRSNSMSNTSLKTHELKSNCRCNGLRSFIWFELKIFISTCNGYIC